MHFRMFAYFQTLAHEPAWYSCLLAAARREGVSMQATGERPTSNLPVIVPVRPEPFGEWNDRLRPLCEHRRRELPLAQWFLAYGYPHDEPFACPEAGVVVANDLANVLDVCAKSWLRLEPWRLERLLAPNAADARYAIHELRRQPPILGPARRLLERLRADVPDDLAAMSAALEGLSRDEGRGTARKSESE